MICFVFLNEVKKAKNDVEDYASYSWSDDDDDKNEIDSNDNYNDSNNNTNDDDCYDDCDGDDDAFLVNKNYILSNRKNLCLYISYLNLYKHM